MQHAEKLGDLACYVCWKEERPWKSAVCGAYKHRKDSVVKILVLLHSGPSLPKNGRFCCGHKKHHHQQNLHTQTVIRTTHCWCGVLLSPTLTVVIVIIIIHRVISVDILPVISMSGTHN